MAMMPAIKIFNLFEDYIGIHLETQDLRVELHHRLLPLVDILLPLLHLGLDLGDEPPVPRRRVHKWVLLVLYGAAVRDRHLAIVAGLGQVIIGAARGRLVEILGPQRPVVEDSKVLQVLLGFPDVLARVVELLFYLHDVVLGEGRALVL
ncbi:hypothetical protein PG997_010513 [Apiospora hydei]|uniref:Uncharacterized protein n=1 Tax=Apiospora hydei TaxID=1337664 RepID=A0ABR1VX66_9PEZI